jgi:hypothetical protein
LRKWSKSKPLSACGLAGRRRRGPPRWTVRQKAPKNQRELSPGAYLATKMIAASTARSSHRRWPPPCTRVGGFGATFRKVSHNPSGTGRSAVAMPEQRLNVNQDSSKRS